MCERPNTIKGIEVSCRNCGQCFATYKNSWVSRCVAEKTVSKFAYAVTLTYADVDGKPPLGAKVFNYPDVALLWKSIRNNAAAKWPDQGFSLRYVIVGEKGTRYGRCHYHGVLFSSHDLSLLGDFTIKGNEGFKLKRRLNWTLWPHGFVEFQLADRKGMAYVLKYILKGRMNAKKAAGTRHEGKTEWLASSYLWCSKVPSIGSVWLWHKLKSLADKGVCPSSLRVRVPNGGDWYVSGRLQKEMCLYLHEANAKYRAERGRDLGGFKTLVESVSGTITKSDTGEELRRKPWEWLINGEEEEEQIDGREHAQRQFRQFEAEYTLRRRIGARVRSARKSVDRCGNIEPCATCAGNIGRSSAINIAQEYSFRYAQWSERFPIGKQETIDQHNQRFKQWWKSRLRPSRLCALKHTEELKSDFRYLVPLEKARPFSRYAKAIGGAMQEAPD